MKEQKIKKVLLDINKLDLGKYNKPKKTIIDLLLLVLAITVIISMIYVAANDTNIYVAEFNDCVDGDTIKVLINNDIKTVRLLAIDTPEIGNKAEYYGEEASEYTCNLITNAKKIKVELDSNADKYDKYGRLLGWVYVDEKLLQGLLIKDGYAEVAYLYGDYLYTDDIEKLELQAQQNKLGIWAEED